jgi:hypothetical protein
MSGCGLANGIHPSFLVCDDEENRGYKSFQSLESSVTSHQFARSRCVFVLFLSFVAIVSFNDSFASYTYLRSIIMAACLPRYRSCEAVLESRCR